MRFEVFAGKFFDVSATSKENGNAARECGSIASRFVNTDRATNAFAFIFRIQTVDMVKNAMYSEDEDSQEDQYVNYKQKYRELKKNLRHLIYENETFQDELRKAQHNFVSISRDKNFLLDRILKYEKPQGPSSDSEATESSDEDEETKTAMVAPQFFNQRKKITKRKRSEAEVHNGTVNASQSETVHVHPNAKQTPARPVASKPVSGKGGSMAKRPKKPPTGRKPSVKKEKDASKAAAERTPANSHVMKGYDLGGPVEIRDEEQGEFARPKIRGKRFP